MIVRDLGLLAYRAAWAEQEAAHAQVVAGGEEQILLVEHPPVITFGRRAGDEKNLTASAEQLQKLGVELVHTDRGGDVTFHGPGQIVAYPILRLGDRQLLPGRYVHRLEEAVIAALREIEICARVDPQAPGVWVDEQERAAKVCAIGVRIRQGVSLHGLALNVDPDLSYFNLIVPCGLSGKPVTSVRKLLGSAGPSLSQVKQLLARHLLQKFQTAPAPLADHAPVRAQ